MLLSLPPLFRTESAFSSLYSSPFVAVIQWACLVFALGGGGVSWGGGETEGEYGGGCYFDGEEVVDLH